MRKSLFIGFVAVLGLIGCSRNQEIDVPDANLSIFAKTESPADTKTVVESGVHVFWEPGDEIAVFTGEQSAKFTTDITAASGTATFKGTFGDTTWPEDLDLWAVYPFSEDAVFDGETITTTLPSEQVAREGSFGKDMNLAIAHSSGTTLQFYNVGGGIRFSVTEEGIKKVMFEGLSGEIISGKVKIGMDENGKPEVKEITGGSQFITLLPPDGSKTFLKDTWYYIVAIPGTLEGGYKLRFYKDSDYARKVSEKAVEIKRSIYGTLDNADEGIDFEPLKTHFPETEEEKEASIVRIEKIAEQTKSIIDRIIIDHSISDEVELIKGFSSIEGVINCSLNESKDVAYLMLADSVFVNVRLIEDSSKWSNGKINPSIRSAPTKPTSKNVIASKRLLILSPYQSEIKNWSAVKCSYLEECLAPLGFQVDSLINNEVKLDHFCGDHLKQYDVVLITTHGNYNLTVNGKECSAIDTGERVSLGSRVIRYFDRESDISFAIAKGVPTYAATAAWMEKTTSDLGPTSFNNSLVLLQACYSYYSDEYYNYFINHGVSAFGGFNPEADKQVSRAIVSKLIFYLSSGVDFKTAAEYVKTADSDVIATYNHVKQEKGDSPDVSPESFHFTPNSHYFITDSHPKQLEHKVNSDGTHYFSWEMAPSWGSLLFDIVIDGKTIHENLVIDDSYDFSDPSNRQLSFSFVPTSFTPSSEERKYPWSVIAKVYVDDEFFASYQTDGEPFTVKEQIPDPPQVETFPASVDAQKAFLSGMVTNRSLEGLETGFYYYKLTDQEESTELSASEKERLVMGGKKVLSAGDYKDYFGIDLTDIEQDSKYLFVAYATDEYSQTGKGEVLSFTTGSPSVHVSSVSLNMSSLELGVGNTATLVATVLPENASNKKVTWSSSNPSKATVSSTGVVTGVAEGAAVVTATTVDGGKTASCFVTVRQATQPDPGESGNALIELSCAELDWGDVEIGNNVTKTFTVKNTGTTALNISSVSIVATDNTVNPSYFSIMPNSSSTVSPGNSSAFNVTFIPESECGYYAIVSIKSNAGNATQGMSTVWLSGVGIKASSSYSVATPDIIDLGLSVKWASFNLGATSPEEYGDYFAWGETEPYYISQDPLTWKEGKEAGYDWPSYKWCEGSENSLTKYCTDSSFGYNGFTDGKMVLDQEDDAAHVHLGGSWRIPTRKELDELRDRCTAEWTSLNGINGHRITGPNGNSIFIPAAGHRYKVELYSGKFCGLWSSSLYLSRTAFEFYSNSGGVGSGWNSPRIDGQPIRPVCAK